MKKLVSLVLALALVLLCVGAVMADAPTTPAATVTVNEVTKGNYVKLYKIADAAIGEDNAIHYTMASGLPAGYDTIDEIMATASDADAVTAMANAYGAVFGGTEPDYSEKNDDGTTVTISNVAAGYYFAIVSGDADTSVVYKSMLINAVPVANASNGYDGATPSVTAKKETITIEKTEYDPASEEWAKTTDGYSRGDTIPFHIDTRFPNYPSDSKYATFIIADDPDGLQDTVSSVKVYVDGTAEANLVAQDDAKFTVAATTDGFTVTFTKAFVLANAGKSVRVAYDAVLTAPSVGSGDTTNTATITYNPNPFEDTTVTPPDTDEQHTYGLVFEKVDDATPGNPLAGATFALYDEAGTTAITQNGTALTFTTEVVNGHAYVYWDGLEAGTYTIKETQAPSGYVAMADFQMTVNATVSVNDNPATDTEEDNYTVAENPAVNVHGVELPSTGGIGTTIFYILGGLLVIGAAVILVARRKAHD